MFQSRSLRRRALGSWPALASDIIVSSDSVSFSVDCIRLLVLREMSGGMGKLCRWAKELTVCASVSWDMCVGKGWRRCGRVAVTLAVLLKRSEAMADRDDNGHCFWLMVLLLLVEFSLLFDGIGSDA